MAAPGPAVVSTGNFTATSGTRLKPTGTAAGDLLIFVASSDTASTVPTYTATDFGPGTINELQAYDTSAYGGATTTFQAWWKIAGSSEPASYTLGVSVSRITVFTVVRIPAGTFDPADPFNQVAYASNDTGAATEPTLPSVTTTSDENLIVRFVAWDESKTLSAAPAGHTNLYHQDLSGHDQRADQEELATAGSAGTAVYDLSSGTRWMGLTVAIQPPQGAGAQTVSPTGIAATGGVGSPSLSRNITPAGIAPAGGVGQPRVALEQTIAPAGIAPIGGVGAPTVRAVQTIAPAGIAPAGGVGQPSLSRQIRPNGIAPGGGVGVPTVRGVQTVSPAGIAPGGGLGAPRLAMQIRPAGIGPAGGVGQPTLAHPPAQILQLQGIAPIGGVGVPTLVRDWGLEPGSAVTWSPEEASPEDWTAADASAATWSATAPAAATWSPASPTPESWS